MTRRKWYLPTMAGCAVLSVAFVLTSGFGPEWLAVPAPAAWDSTEPRLDNAVAPEEQDASQQVDDKQKFDPTDADASAVAVGCRGTGASAFGDFLHWLWSTAWGLEFNEDDSGIALVETTDLLIWELAVTSANADDPIVGTGTLSVAVWLPLASLDPDPDLLIGTTVLGLYHYVLAGELQAQTGFQSPVYGVAVHAVGANSDMSALALSAWAFVPLGVAASVQEAEYLAQRYRLSILEPEPGGGMFLDARGQPTWDPWRPPVLPPEGIYPPPPVISAPSSCDDRLAECYSRAAELYNLEANLCRLKAVRDVAFCTPWVVAHPIRYAGCVAWASREEVICLPDAGEKRDLKETICNLLYELCRQRGAGSWLDAR